jgi:hypothetical protein
MKIIVISDPHAFAEEAISALRASGELDSPDSVVLIDGDILDRGPEPERLVDFLIELKEAGRLILIRGNHEDLLEEALVAIERGKVVEVLSASCHVENGTADTILALAGMTCDEGFRSPRLLVERVRSSRFYTRLLPSCLDYYETDRYVFTHGWLPCISEGYGRERRYYYDPNWRKATPAQWRVARTRNGMELAVKHGVKEPEKTVVVGHWHTSYGHAEIDGTCSEYGDDAITTPFFADGIIALDANTSRHRRVNCIVLEA